MEELKQLLTLAYNHLSVAMVSGDAAEHVGDARKILREAFSLLPKDKEKEGDKNG